MRVISSRLLTVLKKQLRALKSKGRIVVLKVRNLSSCNRVVEQGGPTVSLTTFGSRLETVYLTIESIACGKVKPGELILWLDEAKALESLHPALQRLKARGLRIERCENLGPHKKYFPFVRSRDRFGVALVTADDDVLYPTTWLEGLWSASASHPDDVICYRAHVVAFKEGALAPYRSWSICRTGIASPRNFATGVSGVLYPPRMLQTLKALGDEFMNVCPRADDVWLHRTALRGGHLVRQLTAEPIHFPVIPGTQASGLLNQNWEGGNDQQIAATYSAADIEKLKLQES